MTRDELILDCQDIVKNLVRKYNNHKVDEDLVSVGMIEIVKCVDKCLKDDLTDREQIRARCNTWARNAILNEIYKEKVKVADDPAVVDTLTADENISYAVHDLKKVLSPRENKILDCLLSGLSDYEIMAKFSVKKRMVCYYKERIKEKIKNLHCTFDEV